MPSQAHNEYYSQAELYDIAFSFKEYSKEADFMLSQFQEITGRKAESWLEFAAGPARHTLEMAKRGLKARALDLSKSMVHYGSDLAKSAGLTIDYKQGDMIEFIHPEKSDLAGLMIDSISYLLDNESVYQHLRSVAGSLNDGGIYIIELAHPKDHLTKERTTGTDWEMERDGVKVHTIWGAESDPLDPITQTTNTTVTITASRNGKSEKIIDHAKQRFFTCTEFQALIKASGCFEIAKLCGAMDPAIDLYHEKAWRMIAVLQKTD